jgi:formylglycine-generating enzyme required for sulfatase activity
MKKIYLFLFALFCAGMVYGQNKEVAVLNSRVIQGTVSENDKLMITSCMKKAFNEISGYKAFTRKNQALLDAEMDFQNSGMISETQMKKIAEQTAADYICIHQLSLEMNELVVNSDIIDVVTGEIINSDFITLYDRKNENEVMKKCQSLANNLLGTNFFGGILATYDKNLSFTVNNTIFEMVFVESGSFNMGCPFDQNVCGSDEKPLHSVTLDDFYIGKFPVTQKLWEVVMGTTIEQQRDLANHTWPLRGEGEDYPIYYVNFKECEDFCAKLTRLLANQLPEGFLFRLPTEAQWEYAARGGKKSKGFKYSGSNIIDDVAWYDGNSGAKAHEVGLKKKNELGIYDMSGHVWEWCRDWYSENYYSSSPSHNPHGPVSGSHRVLRGGSWRFGENTCRITFRGDAPGNRGSDDSFRLTLVQK